MFTGSPPAAPVFRNGALAGYLFSTYAVTGSAGYSGKPLDVLAGIDLDARITGALLRHHNEPILVIGISPRRWPATSPASPGWTCVPASPAAPASAARDCRMRLPGPRFRAG
ncbi:MAG: hypothetical protein U1E35_07680 [Rhodospirillales bacterium]